MVKVAVIVGSTRPGRKALDVARRVMETAVKRSDATFELVDLQDFNLPLLDEPVPPAMDQYLKPHTVARAEKIAHHAKLVDAMLDQAVAWSGALAPLRQRTG